MTLAIARHARSHFLQASAHSLICGSSCLEHSTATDYTHPRSQACYRNERALTGHQLGREPAELLAVDGHDGGTMMFGMTVLELVETMVERLVANRGAGFARLEAFAMELVVMVGMLLGLRMASRPCLQVPPRPRQ